MQPMTKSQRSAPLQLFGVLLPIVALTAITAAQSPIRMPPPSITAPV